MRYDPKKIEKKWQKRWISSGTYEPDLRRAKKPFYNLMMFPYPSAEGLHIGSVRTFSGVDIYGRLKRMQGHDVFEPMGLDGFGIHSENYALKVGKHPFQHAKDSEKNFYRQLKMIGNGFAWKEHLETYDPEYYRWTQWIFTQMFKRGLAYRKKAAVNWCPGCRTVLADEQVVSGGCERCGSKVIKKELEQWFFKITDYAERLLNDLDHIDWPEPIKIAQRNWIGKSEGALINFPIDSDYNYVFLHGFKGSPQSDFWPWLKRKLEERGSKIYALELPNPANPNIEEQSRYVLNSVRFDEKTIIVTHSLGGVLAMKLLAKIKTKIAGLVMVAPPLRTEFLDGKPRPALEAATDWRFRFDKIKEKVEWITVIKDIGDKIVPSSHPEEIARNLNAKLVEVSANKSHFNSEEEPVVLKEVTPSIEVFTTRPDTLFGATYLVLGPEHRLLGNKELGIRNYGEVEEYIKKAKAKTDEERIAEGKEKTGVELKGVKAINPANGAEIPVWVADYVLGNVGTGAIMAVPAHDNRDFEFAKKFNLLIRNVIAPKFGEKQGDEVVKKTTISAVVDPKTKRVIVLNWGPRQERTGGYMLIGGTIHEGEDAEKTARREIAEETGYIDLKLIRVSGVSGYGYFYSNTKNHNVFATGTGLLFELQSDKKIPQKLDDGEHGKFKVEWHPIEKVAAMLDDGIHEYFFRELVLKEVFTDKGQIINSGKFDGLDSEKAKWEITKFVGGERKTQYRLRDWLISRQRYWGPPIPMIFCEKCQWQPVPENDLPVKLPYIKDFHPQGTGKSPLAAEEKFYKVRCPKCKSWASRETDVSDTFLDSSWYYLGYLMTWDKQKHGFGNLKFENLVKKWLPVDMYIGGAEHAVLHLLYVRFLAMTLHDWKLVHFEEPFKKFRTHGLITKDGAKMSKSRGNVVNPDDYINAYGSDAVRMYLAFLAPLDRGGDFQDEGIRGITRFLERVCGLMTNNKLLAINREKNAALQRLVHKTIKKVTEDIENFQYNTAISALMVLLNEFEKNSDYVGKEDKTIFLKLLAPFAPHISEELFQQLFRGPKPRAQSQGFHSIHAGPWPKFNPGMIKEDTFELIIQVNGKMRGKISLSVGTSQTEAQKAALAVSTVGQYVVGPLRKVVFVPNKLINFVA